ncbi:hypothetical protein M407DRAFT_13171 [Tulasnella calospora MUT 4182]|uniref:Uncharacterized protein n=1 Tax=Tulasnella calospora MUT 4182 TaxID=1051891 RepID=A0A0C3Q082_9AGAM|nr:hypothetical protein M407DRAFT_13171 [Tulasnella calospora MUT 4182]
MRWFPLFVRYLRRLVTILLSLPPRPDILKSIAMLNEISRLFTGYKVGLGRPPSRVPALLLELQVHSHFLRTTNSFKRQLSTKPVQNHTFEAHLEARKEYVKALDARFVPDMPAREVRALSSRITRLLHPVVRKAPTSPCPNLATLKLDQALKDGQWLLIRPARTKRDRLKVTLRTLLPRGSVISSPLYIPRSISEGAHAIWFCPYFDPETLTLRFRKASGDDSTVMLPLKRLLMSECGRSLAELAYAEGLIPSAVYTSALSEVQETQAVDEAIPQAQELAKPSKRYTGRKLLLNSKSFASTKS